VTVPKLYVMSYMYYHARRFAEDKGVSGPTGLRWINRDQDMRGLRGITVYVLPSAYHIRDFSYLMDLAAVQNFEIVHVRDER
jgi:hypothetical protein